MKNLTSKLVAGMIALTPLVYTGCGIENSKGLSYESKNETSFKEDSASYTKPTSQIDTIYSQNGITVITKGDCDCLKDLAGYLKESKEELPQKETRKKRASYLEKTAVNSNIKTSPGSKLDSADCATKGDLDLSGNKEYCSTTIGDKEYFFKKDDNSYYGFVFSTMENAKTSINLSTKEISKETSKWFHPSEINQDSIKYEPKSWSQKRNLRRLKSKEENGKTTNTEIINAEFKTLEIPEVGKFVILGSQNSGEPILVPLNSDTNFDIFSKDVYYFKNFEDNFIKLKTN